MTFAALINWAKSAGEAEDYRDNLSSQCIHPVGHWYEIPNLLLHNIDTLGANADPAVLGYHIQQQKAMTVFITFNYTDFLESLYGIPPGQIIYLHGNKNEKLGSLVLGHGQDPEKNFENWYHKNKNRKRFRPVLKNKRATHLCLA